MRYLLDTHVVIWWLADEPSLPSRAAEVIADVANTIFVSAMSIWEITIKASLGKLEVDVDEVLAALSPAGLEPLSFGIYDAAEVRALPALHRDPFDRALVAQARRNGLQLLTDDDRLAAYGAPVVRLSEI